MRKTKIVATIGPASDSEESIRQMIEKGVDVFRFNMKHGSVSWHNQRLERVEKVCRKVGKRVALLIDLQGPEIRIKKVQKKFQIINSGQEVKFSGPGGEGIILDHKDIFQNVGIGQTIFAEDGLLEFKVIKVGKNWAQARVIEGGNVSERKTVNFPRLKFDFPTLVERDLKHLSLAVKHHVDFVALSFVRKPQDIKVLREELNKQNIDCKIISKIEHPGAVKEFDKVLEKSDGVMIARGDLGIEFPMEEVPSLQKKIVNRCREEGKPVIIATQMLESMISSIRPTRAEVSDVANAVYDSADAVMLSAETAIGKNPIRAVHTMRKIVDKVDETITHPRIEIDWKKGGQTAAVVSSANMLMEFGFKGVCDIEAFVVFTETGRTVQYLSRLRPKFPIITLTNNEKTLDQLKLSWGVIPVHYQYSKTQKLDEKKAIRHIYKLGLVKKKMNVIMIYGELLGKPGLTSVIRIQHVI